MHSASIIREKNVISSCVAFMITQGPSFSKMYVKSRASLIFLAKAFEKSNRGEDVNNHYPAKTPNVQVAFLFKLSVYSLLV